MLRLLIIIAFLVQLNILNAQWEVINEGLNGTINTVDFVDENHGWVGGGKSRGSWGKINGEGTLLRTEDGGANWDIIPINQKWSFTQIDFYDESTGWAIGEIDDSLGVVFYTSDAGDNWIIQSIMNVDLYCLHVLNETHVYVGGNEGTLFSTTDGGINWINISVSSSLLIESVCFINQQVGLAFADSIGNDSNVSLRTQDAGTSWEKLNNNDFDLRDLQMINDSVGYSIGWSLLDGGYLLKTIDTCSTWMIKKHFSNDILYFKILNENIYVATVDSLYIGSNNVDYWEYIAPFPNFGTPFQNQVRMIMTNYGNLFFTGNKNICYSENYGQYFKTQYLSYPINDIYILNDTNGLMVGGNFVDLGVHSYGFGHALFTTNTGKTWLIKLSTWDASAGWRGSGNRIMSCYFLTENIVFITASEKGIYKTTDTGENWTLVFENNPDSNGYDFMGNGIGFINSQEGFAVGRYKFNSVEGAGILFTTDAGENWNPFKVFPDSSNFDYEYHSICNIDSTFWAVGESGMIVKYTSPNEWILQESSTTLPLNKVYFLDESHGWISGGYLNDNNFQTILLKTSNGGETWESDQSNSYLMNDIYFGNRNNGYAVGCDADEKGVILRSTDGGESWDLQVGNLNGALKSISVKKKIAWVAGENGQILKTTDAGLTWVNDKNDKIYFTEFSLEQNYPNPFNPSTIINYQLAGKEKVQLKIYDVLGTEITTLVNEEKDPGSYKVELNAANLPSGVYFYKLQAGEFTATKKMLLLK